jgi:hypothetical protein
MDTRVVTFIEEKPGLIVVALLGVAAVLVGLIWVAPAFVSLIVDATVAGGWCWWLETFAAHA